MKHLVAVLAIALVFLTQSAHASVRVFNSSGTNIGTFTDVQAGNGLSVSQVSGKAKFVQGAGDGSAAMYGFLQHQISTSGSLTAAQCGSTVSSDAAASPVPLFTLPTLSSAIYGCRFTFIVSATTPTTFLTVTPDASSKIFLASASSGHSVSASTQGDSVTLEAISTGWAPVGGANGTWYAN